MTGHVTETYPSLSHEWHSLVDVLGDSGEYWLRVKLAQKISSIV